MKILWMIARFFVGGVFAYAGFLKLTAPVEEFHAQILEYGLFSYQPALIVAWIFPWIEVLCGVFLILGFMTRTAAMGCASMALSFLVLMGLSYLKLGHLPESCGCFGQGIKLPIYVTIILDAAMVFIGIQLARSKKHYLSLDAKLS